MCNEMKNNNIEYVFYARARNSIYLMYGSSLNHSLIYKWSLFRYKEIMQMYENKAIWHNG